MDPAVSPSKILPRFTQNFFTGIESRTSAKTRLSYAYDLKVFFSFIKNNNPLYRNTEIHDFTYEDLERITADDIEEYLQYLKKYTDEDGNVYRNSEQGLHRKLASLRSFYGYFYRKEKIKSNPAQNYDIHCHPHRCIS